MKIRFLKIAFIAYSLLLILGNNHLWAQNTCSDFLFDQKPDRPIFTSSTNYRLDKKVFTFPDINQEAIDSMIYTKEISGIRQKDQCSEGCSFNSVASYIEAFISFYRTGKLTSKFEISANYMHAMFLFFQFRYALMDLDRTISSGGGLEWNLVEFLNQGFRLESDFRSVNTVDVESIRQRLNQRLKELKQTDPNALNIDQVAEGLFAFQVLKKGFGTSPLGGDLYAGANFLKKAKIHSINYQENAKMLETVSGEGESSFVPLTRIALEALAEKTIIDTINQGLPLLLSYRHSRSYINPETGILSYDPTITPDVGHAALIIGYKLGNDGKIKMLKIQNSHANAPVFHMTIESLSALANSIVYLTL